MSYRQPHHNNTGGGRHAHRSSSNNSSTRSSSMSSSNASNRASSNNASTRTIHVAYNARQTDRASLFLTFRKYPGFDIIAQATLNAQNHYTPHGVTTYEAAKQYYEVPYPQPDDENRGACKILHITHLPANYSKSEIEKIFGLFPGYLNETPNIGRFTEAHFYGKYGYSYFESEQSASHARQILRGETNLVVSFAKSAPKPVSADDDAQTIAPRFSIVKKTVLSTAPAAESPAASEPIQTVTSNSNIIESKTPHQPVPQSQRKPSRQSQHRQSQHRQSSQHFDRAPGAGRAPQGPRLYESLPTPSAFSQIHQQHRSPDLHPASLYPASSINRQFGQEKVGQEIFQTLAFGYDWRGGSMGLKSLDTRVPFNIESFRAEENVRGGVAVEGGMAQEESDIDDDGMSWNPFTFDTGVE